MYGLEGMIEIGLNGEWTSEDHRKVAVNLCICNPNIRNKEDLSNNVEIINSIKRTEIRTVTHDELAVLGCVM
jgi:hypothetical protein